MGRILVIARREVSSLFVSPIAYVVLFLFMIFMGILFVVPALRIFQPGEFVDVSFRQFSNFSRFALFFVVPMLTMSIFADEYRSGRIEMLRTSPVTEFQLVMGKFFGVMAFYLSLLASTVLFYIIFLLNGRPDLGQVISTYLGMILMGCMFVACGLFFSSCTREPIVAALSAVITLGVLTITDIFATSLPREWVPFKNFHIPIRPVVEYLTVGSHFGDFTRGSVELGNIMYFAGCAALFLFWTYIVLESKRWR